MNPVSPKTSRDSFAVHLLMNAVLQSLLGHKKAETTEIYTKMFTLDVSQRAGVRFLMAPEDAMAMLRSAQSGSPELPRGVNFWVRQTECGAIRQPGIDVVSFGGRQGYAER